MRSAKLTHKPEALPAVVPTAESHMLGASMATFLDGTDGRIRGTWGRLQFGPSGYGWDATRGGLYAVQNGGRSTREASQASYLAHDMAIRNPTLSTILETLVTEILGTGLVLASKPVAALLGITPDVARQLSTAIELKWTAYASNARECDLSGRLNVDSLAEVFLRHCILDGEGLACMEWARRRDAKYRTCVSILDPSQLDRTQTKTVEGGSATSGVVFDRTGRLQGYLLVEVPLGAITYTTSAKYVSAFTSWGRCKVLHVFKEREARQVRGISHLASALTPANERESLVEFAIAGALIATSYAATIESELPPREALSGLDPGHNGIGDMLEAREEFYSKTKIELSPGVISHLPPGDKLKMTKSPNDGAQFAPFSKDLMRSASRAAGVSYESTSGDFSDTSFSASRLALMGPFRTTLRMRKDYVEPFYKTVFANWLDEAVETGEIILPEGLSYWDNREVLNNCQFLGQGPITADPKKQVEADLLEVENGFATFESKLAERGLNMDTHLANIKAERALMKDAGLDRAFYPGATTTQIRDENIEESNKLKDSEDPNDV